MLFSFVFFLLTRRPPISTRTYTIFPSTSLFRSRLVVMMTTPLAALEPYIEADPASFITCMVAMSYGLRSLIFSVGTPSTTKSGLLFSNVLIPRRSEEHTSELKSLMRTSYAVFCLKKKKTENLIRHDIQQQA